MATTTSPPTGPPGIVPVLVVAPCVVDETGLCEAGPCARLLPLGRISSTLLRNLQPLFLNFFMIALDCVKQKVSVVGDPLASTITYLDSSKLFPHSTGCCPLNISTTLIVPMTA